jgi:hypothetical protein
MRPLPHYRQPAPAPTGGFIAELNVARFRHQLENGAEGANHATLLRLLVEHLNLLGFSLEQLHEMDRQIARIKVMLATQVDLAATLQAHGQEMERAEAWLARILDLLIVHEEHRAQIAAALRNDRGGLSRSRGH